VALFKRPASTCMRKLIVSICLTKTQSKTESPKKQLDRKNHQEKNIKNRKINLKKQKTKIKSWIFISFF
jgi:hypothetical protein